MRGCSARCSRVVTPGRLELTHVMCMMDAQNYLSKHAVDIILLDLGLPDADGLEAVKRPRRRTPDSFGGADRPGRRNDGRAGAAKRRARLSYQGPNQDTRAQRAMRYATERKRLERLKGRIRRVGEP